MRVAAVLTGALLALATLVPASVVPATADTAGPDGVAPPGDSLFAVVAAASTATLHMAASARDRTPVDVIVTWRRTVDSAGLTGRLRLELQRTGTSTWTGMGGVDVVDGAGAATITPRDDGRFRVRWTGSAELAAVASPPVPFDNVPVRDVRLRIGQYNLPGPDKLARSTTRARRAGVEVRRLDPDVLVLNELVGPGRDSMSNRPSRFARSVLRALGGKWAMVTPTMTYNENYVAYRTDRLRVVAHYPDRVVPGTGKKHTARHVTPVLLKDVASNQPFLLVGTHLVSGDDRGARRQAHSVGAHAAALSSGYPVVVAGDMNTPARLDGLTAIDLKDARLHASSHVNAAYSTFTSYSKRTPSRSQRRILDRIHVPRGWTVRRWTTALDTRNGVFVQPRASDHSLVSASMVGPRPSG